MEQHGSWRVFGIVLAILAAGWVKADPPKKGPSPKSPSASSTAEPRDEVAALVNGERIMLSELLARLDELGVAPEKRESVAGDVLDALIDNALLVQFLSAQKIPYDSKAVDAEIAQLRSEVEKQGGKLAPALAHFGMTPEKFRASVIAQAQWDTYTKQRITDKELAGYFAQHRESFDGSQVRASHILVEVPASADAAQRTAAKGKIERIRQELAAGLDFAAAAKKYSDCPSKTQGGDVGSFPRHGKMVEPFAKAAFALKVGETSGTIETEFGYHLIKVTERKAGNSVKPSDPAVRVQLIEAVGEQLKDSIIARERKTAKIEIAPDIPTPNTTKDHKKGSAAKP